MTTHEKNDTLDSLGVPRFSSPAGRKEAVRQFIVRAVPSIQSTYHESTGNNLRCKNCGEPDSYENRGTCKKGKTRSISLADVLAAIWKKNPANKTLVNIECDGQFLVTSFESGATVRKLGPTWDLPQDFDHQSEAVWEFLYGLLV